MNRRDATIDIECIICGRIFPIQVNKEDYENFYNSSIEEIDDLENCFPYLTDDEIDFIVTRVCHHCT